MSLHAPTDAERYPLLSPAGRRLLDFMREHPAAPIFRNTSGNRLGADDLAFVRRHESDVLAATVGWPPGAHPDWLRDFVVAALREVPRFADYDPHARFEDLPTVTRADLGRDIAPFVSTAAPVDELINYQTSGTTGHPLLVASHPRVAAGYLAYHKRALRRFGGTLTAGRGQVGVVLLGFQQTCFTYVSVTPSMDEAGLAKINLAPTDWRDPADRVAYLTALAPEVISGDPLSFAELLRLAPPLRPKALLCTSMTLLDGLRDALTAAFACPVLDLYSLNEVGPVAVFDPAAAGHVLLQPHLYVEILDPAGQPVPAGSRGEITLTGGFNFCLPLLRYRTGDFASLDRWRGEPVLRALEGRPVVRFRRADGTWLNNIEVTHALRPFPLTRFSLHQNADGSLRFWAEGSSVACDEARAALAALFGPTTAIAELAAPPLPASGKIVQYTSALSA